MGRPLVISASRRTDLPGFHAHACRDRILKKMAGLRTRHLYGVIFWTKHVRAFLPGGPLHALTASTLDNPLVNLTISGLGGTPLEPNVPDVGEALGSLPALIAAFHGEPWRIRWRFDPLLKGHTSLEMFRRIAQTMVSLGISTCTFSFPAYFSLKGDLSEQFARAGIPKWETGEKDAFLDGMTDIAAALGMALLSCAQPENLARHPYVRNAVCIPADVLSRGHPSGLPLDLPRDPCQRSKCLCIQSEDIGDYALDRCGGGCVYCYSKAGGPAAGPSDHPVAKKA